MAALIFTLSMPGRASWDGRWSGQDRAYRAIRPLYSGKKQREKAERIVANGPYSYSWNDGWCASISVRIAEGAEITKLRRTSNGFCGYDWMVSSILDHGAIYGPDQPKPKPEAA